LLHPKHFALPAFAAEGIDTTNMKMSEITALKEQRERARGAEIIAADAAYRPTVKSFKGR
jgi:hypothetical protein